MEEELDNIESKNKVEGFDKKLFETNEDLSKFKINKKRKN